MKHLRRGISRRGMTGSLREMFNYSVLTCTAVITVRYKVKDLRASVRKDSHINVDVASP